MEKKLTKKEKGITLVALIITIIVLLILAVVSIRAITGDNTLGKAETAKNKYESAKSNELDILKDYENNIEPEKFDIQKVMNKAYIWKNFEGAIAIGYFTGDKIKLIGIYEGTDAKPEGSDSEYKVTALSDFESLTVHIGEKPVIISPQTATKLIIEGHEEYCMYITEQYLFYQMEQDGKFESNETNHSNMRYLDRNEAYNDYVK